MFSAKRREVCDSIIKSVKEAEANAILSIPSNGPYLEVVKFMNECSERNGKVIVIGVGKSHSVAKRLATTLNSVKISSFFLDPLSVIFGDSGASSNNDLLFFIDTTGENASLIHAFDVLKKASPQIKTILVCGVAKSSLAVAADFTLLTGNPPEVCTLGYTPTTSMTVTSAIINILFVLLQRVTNFSEDVFETLYGDSFIPPTIEGVVGAPKEVVDLKAKEIAILNQLALGGTMKVIAKQLDLSIDGVNFHARAIYKKLKAKNKSEAISKAVAMKIIKV